MNEKSEGKRYQGTEEETGTPTPAIDALIGDEQQTGKKEEQKERQNKVEVMRK